MEKRKKAVCEILVQHLNEAEKEWRKVRPYGVSLYGNFNVIRQNGEQVYNGKEGADPRTWIVSVSASNRRGWIKFAAVPYQFQSVDQLWECWVCHVKYEHSSWRFHFRYFLPHKVAPNIPL